jgi:hypothetical protein
MMQSILEDLYYGRISPWERHPIQTHERCEINFKIAEEKRALIEKLSSEDIGCVQHLENLYTKSSEFEQIDAFSCGFKLGVELIVSVYIGSK